MVDVEVPKILGKSIQKIIREHQMDYHDIQEIRLRIGQPLVVVYKNREIMFPHIVDKKEFMETLDYISDYSLYAYENELRQGFITVEGGHRVGMAGQVLVEQGEIKNLHQISSMNVRVSHEVLHCGDLVLPYLIERNEVCHTLLISPPRCGKTTLLRDLIRQISDGNKWLEGKNVGVVDERSELGGCYHGIPQNHLGKRTDILDCCPKAKGMLMLVRSMSPDVIAVDEIGSAEDVQALEYAMHCGCKIIATVHGSSMEEMKEKPMFQRLIRQHLFQRYVLLGNRKRIGFVDGIYDERGSLLFREQSV